ncbi:uncharacterized protein LOC112541391 isoform X1 [Python bivittatus]|uniref:Uncharacterized protein LOC112541391 isoform X1 n=1 Tax=Python bivittatus TaxID=176946 RepID=A0A9F5IV83_PYTBI|nr:uncharacterized protein LOC112541391 isoform X1 [Python bivittatus]
MQCKKMFKMDFSFSFSLPCMLIILTITSGKICTADNSTIPKNSSPEPKDAHPVIAYNLSKEDKRKCPGNETSFICCGDLLQHPLFLYVLTACGGGAVLLAITASLITCCCMKAKHNFIQVPVEDEKDEGITMSAISSERPKSPPNGDHCEVTDVLVDSTPNTSAQTCESFKPDHKEDPIPSVEPEMKSESRREEKVGTETEFQEVTVDNAAQEVIDDCFPDPIDA